MYLRETKRRNRDGSTVSYLQLAHSERHPVTGVPSARVIHNFGRADTVEGFLYATGFSGHGFLMGPAVGEVVGDLYLGEEPFVDVSGLSAARFASAGARRELNIV